MSTSSAEKHVSKKGFLKSGRSRILLAVVIFIIICAAVIPPVVVTELRKKNSMGPKSKVIVPLYVYPAPGAWTPLEKEYVCILFPLNFLSRLFRFPCPLDSHTSTTATSPAWLWRAFGSSTGVVAM